MAKKKSRHLLPHQLLWLLLHLHPHLLLMQPLLLLRLQWTLLPLLVLLLAPLPVLLLAPQWTLLAKPPRRPLKPLLLLPLLRSNRFNDALKSHLRVAFSHLGRS